MASFATGSEAAALTAMFDLFERSNGEPIIAEIDSNRRLTTPSDAQAGGLQEEPPWQN